MWHSTTACEKNTVKMYERIDAVCLWHRAASPTGQHFSSPRQESTWGQLSHPPVPHFHCGSCALSVCSSWSLFFPFLKVTSTALCLRLCVRAVISSHLQHVLLIIQMLTCSLLKTCRKGEKSVEQFCRALQALFSASIHKDMGNHLRKIP